MFNNVFDGQTVVVTGHTGFKGSWLSLWLMQLGANVVGLSIDIPTLPSHYSALNISNSLRDIRIDVRDEQRVVEVINELEPDFLFHLAAQPIVRKAYDDPIETWRTNVNGTVNILNALRKLDNECVSILITSDKCYENQEWIWGYRETDMLGGYDPYSASKAAAELAIKAFYCSFLQNKDGPRQLIASARAGNVIGGGDWGADRIVPDCIRSWNDGKPVKLRSPDSTRPWQHVLEPISGYLSLAANLIEKPEVNGDAFNFGPNTGADVSVQRIVEEMTKHWPDSAYEVTPIHGKIKKEAGLLRLNCDKAFSCLSWYPVLTFTETVEMTTQWYTNFYRGGDPLNQSLSDLHSFTSLARQRNLLWAT